MPNEPQIREVAKFSGGLPGEALALNKIVEPLNALIRKAKPNGPGNLRGQTIRAVWTVFGEDGSVRLRIVNASNITLGAEITSDEQLL